MTQYLLLKSDGEPDDPSVGLTSDSQGEGGVLGGGNYTASETVGVTRASGFLSTFQTTETSSSSSIGNTQASSLIDQQGGVFSESTAGNYYLHFDQDDGVVTSDDAALHFNDFTVTWWMYRDTALQDNYELIIGNGDGSTSGDGTGGRIPYIYFLNSGDGRFHARVSVDGDGNDGLNTTLKNERGVWEFWTARKDGTTFEVIKNAEFSNADVSTLDSSTLGTGYAGIHYRNDGRNSTTFSLDDCRWFNRALTNNEIQNVKSGDVLYNGLVAWHHFDTGSGTTAVDESGNGISGSFVNDPEWYGDGVRTSAITQTSSAESTTLADALRDAFSASTFGNSSSDTTAGGLTELFTHADQTAAIQSSSLVQAAIVNASSDTFGNSSASAVSQALLEAFDAGVFLADGTSTSQSQSAPTTAGGLDQTGSFTTQTTAGGLIELFTHADQRATLDTSAAVSALTENFDTVQRTAIGEALTGVTGDTTVATANGLQSLGNALAEPLVASETAALTVQDGESFADAYVDALRASGSGLPTGAAGNMAVTSLGTAEVATGTPQFDQTTVEMFAFVSPESATASPTVGTFDTSTSAVALTEDAVMVPITPTMDAVVAVKKGEIGLEGAFADSLSANVGASTTIKVAKTVANAEQQGGALDTTALPDALAATAEALGETGSFTTQTTAKALVVAALVETFGSASTMSDTLGELVTSDSTTIGADGFSSSTPDAAVRDAVASELEASGNTSATSEVLAAAAQTLTEQGVVDTETEAAALVSQYAGNVLQSDEQASTLSDGAVEALSGESLITTEDASTISESLAAVFNGDAIEGSVDTEALALISAALVSTLGVSGEASTATTADGEAAGAELSPVEALLRILFASISGSNAAIPTTEQNVRVSNTENYVEVVSG